MNYIGKTVYVKFGTFHGQMGTIQSEIHANGHDRFLVKLQNGKVIPKKQKNVAIFGEVQRNDYNKEK